MPIKHFTSYLCGWVLIATLFYMGSIMSSRYVQKSITLNLKFQRYPSPFAVGIDNAVRVVYHGDTEYGYPNGIPASGGRVISSLKDSVMKLS